MPQEGVKNAMSGGSVVVVGTSIASHDLMRASWCCGGPLPFPRPHPNSMPFQGSFKLYDCLVNLTVHLTALKLRINHIVHGPKYIGCIGPWPHWPGAPTSRLLAWYCKIIKMHDL